MIVLLILEIVGKGVVIDVTKSSEFTPHPEPNKTTIQFLRPSYRVMFRIRQTSSAQTESESPAKNQPDRYNI